MIEFAPYYVIIINARWACALGIIIVLSLCVCYQSTDCIRGIIIQLTKHTNRFNANIQRLRDFFEMLPFPSYSLSL